MDQASVIVEEGSFGGEVFHLTLQCAHGFLNQFLALLFAVLALEGLVKLVAKAGYFKYRKQHLEVVGVDRLLP